MASLSIPEPLSRSLAGAYELIFDQNQTVAENAAIDFANTNDEAGNADSPVPGSDADADRVVSSAAAAATISVVRR